MSSETLAIFGDPGPALPFTEAAWWWHLAGWPVEPSSVALVEQWGVDGRVFAALALPLVLFALGVVVTPRLEGMALLAVLVPVGLITAAGSSLVSRAGHAESLSGAWPGSGVSLVTLGCAFAVSMTLDTLFPGRTLPGVSTFLRGGLTAMVTVILVLASVLPALGELTRVWRGDSPVQGLAEARVVPALVAAEAATTPGLRTLVITEEAEAGSFRAEVLVGAGPTLETQSALLAARPATTTTLESADAQAVAALVRGGDESVLEHLQARGIRFVVLQGDPLGPAAVSLQTRPFLIPAGQTDDALLWQAADVVVTEPAWVPPNQTQRVVSVAALIVWGLVILLALPTERRPRHRSEDDHEETLMTQGDGEAEDD